MGSIVSVVEVVPGFDSLGSCEDIRPVVVALVVDDVNVDIVVNWGSGFPLLKPVVSQYSSSLAFGDRKYIG